MSENKRLFDAARRRLARRYPGPDMELFDWVLQLCAEVEQRETSCNPRALRIAAILEKAGEDVKVLAAGMLASLDELPSAETESAAERTEALACAALARGPLSGLIAQENDRAKIASLAAAALRLDSARHIGEADEAQSRESLSGFIEETRRFQELVSRCSKPLAEMLAFWLEHAAPRIVSNARFPEGASKMR